MLICCRYLGITDDEMPVKYKHKNGVGRRTTPRPNSMFKQCQCFSLIWTILVPKWPWRSRSINTIFNKALEGPMIHDWCKFGDLRTKAWRVITRTSPFLADFDLFDPKWPWRSWSNSTIYNPLRDLPKMHQLVKFGYPSFNPSKVIARTNSFLCWFVQFWCYF